LGSTYMQDTIGFRFLAHPKVNDAYGALPTSA
jgi:hypothetical protein